MLKGNVLLSMKKLQDSMNHFREAVAIAPYRYETHKGLVDCYLEQARHREAVRYFENYVNIRVEGYFE